MGLRCRGAADRSLDIKINGKDRKVIMQAAKNGFFYVLDRLTGEFISAEPFAQVNWASGYDAKGRPIFNPDVHYGSNSVSVIAGTRRSSQLVADVVQSEHGPGLHSDHTDAAPTPTRLFRTSHPYATLHECRSSRIRVSGSRPAAPAWRRWRQHAPRLLLQVR